ncbi:MAG: hypothetical protein IJX94_05200 [Clostridia bacterium]|nr:hypothetical protein [Clostridia bacterium]
MKKLLCLLLCLLMIVATFAACGTKDETVGETETTTENNAETTDPAPTVTETKKFYGLFIEGIVEYVKDSAGRLTAVWMLDSETLTRSGAYSDELKPWIEFVYGTDGKITECSDMTVTYDGQGNATMGEGESAMSVIIEYHANGSVKKFAGTRTDSNSSYTTEYCFDEQGRFASFGGIEIETDGNNTVTEKSTYNFTYETNKVSVSVVYNDVPVDGMSLVMEFDAEGRPVKVLSSEGEETDEVGWVWNGKQLASYYEYGTMSEGSSDGQGTSVTYKDETFFTYDANGNLTKKENKRDGVLKEYTLYTYNAAGKILSEKDYNAENVEQSSVTYEYDAQGNLLTKTRTKNTGYIEVTDSEGRTIRKVVRNDFTNIPGIGDGYDLQERLYNYDVPAGANYTEIRKEKNSRYMANGTLVEADEYWEVGYYKLHESGYWSEQVDEATGEFLSNGEISCDRYGNYLITEGGTTTGIRYYQKYCGDDGRIFYYTAEGVQTYVTAA